MDFLIKNVEKTDRVAWMAMWAMYCASLGPGGLPERVTERTWERIVDPSEPVNALIATNAEGEALGFCNYVCHLRTWSEQPACYVEDVFVAPAARRLGVATALIQQLRDLGRESNWSRIYWITGGGNVAAQAAYDRIAKRTDHIRFEMSLDT